MQKLREKTIAVINSKLSYPFFSLATFLHAGSLLYGVASRSRRNLYAKGYLPTYKLKCPVISVGNLTVGGTGKTPMVMDLASCLQQQNHKVAIVSRGYKRQSESRVTVVSDGVSVLCNVQEAGDEPFMMAKQLKGVPVVVGKDRFEAGCTAINLFQPDIIILDDAFQHQRLERDLNLVLLDAQAPFGNGFLLPRGPLREPVSSIRRADAIVFTRCRATSPTSHHDFSRIMNSQAIFRAFHRPVIRCVLPPMHPVDGDAPVQPPDDEPHPLSGRKIFAFSGLARNDTFWASIRELGGQILGKTAFEDHYVYNAKDIGTIVRSAKKVGCNSIVTTEKDYVRLPEETALPMDLIVLGISIDFRKNQDAWQRFVAKKIADLRDL